MSDRVYYRHVHTGDRGWLDTLEDGTNVIVLDRPNERIERPFHGESDRSWQLDKETRPLTRYAITQVAFQADSVLCKMLGEPMKNQGVWNNLSDRLRIQWRDVGPQKSEIRRELYQAVMQVLDRWSEPR